MVQRVLVTGGAGGIGAEVARRMASDGARVAVADVDGDRAAAVASELGDGRGRAFRLDVRNADEVAQVVGEAREWLGGLDVAVSSAGVHTSVSVLELREEDWDLVVDVNLKGTFLLAQAAARVMVADQVKGVIVTLTSVMAEVALGDAAHYSASKGGVRQLTKALAVGLAPHGIRVVAVGPGPVATEMNRAILADPVRGAAVIGRVPLDRAGTVAEIADAVAFLSSPSAGFITGSTLYVDGGLLAAR